MGRRGRRGERPNAPGAGRAVPRVERDHKDFRRDANDEPDEHPSDRGLQRVREVREERIGAVTGCRVRYDAPGSPRTTRQRRSMYRMGTDASDSNGLRMISRTPSDAGPPTSMRSMGSPGTIGWAVKSTRKYRTDAREHAHGVARATPPGCAAVGRSAHCGSRFHSARVTS